MNVRTLSVTVSALILMSGLVRAQHVHQPATTQPAAPSVASCAQVQPAIENIIAGAMTRLEGARQANDPAQMRAAVDYFAGALRDIRTQLAPCATPDPAVEPRGGHAMPGTGAPAPGVAPIAKPAAPASGKPAAPPKPKRAAPADPHAGHQMPSVTKKPASPKPAKPAAPRPEAKAADPHAAHGATPQTQKEIDPVNGLRVDPSTAPKTTYQGRTYYFSSEQSLKEFLQSPEKFAKPSKK